MTAARRARHGFTLIELLVVIAIIALLVSILLPSLRKAKDLAKSAVCLSQLRGTDLAFAMYREDYANGLYYQVDAGNPPYTGSGYFYWPDFVVAGDYASYLTLRCPSQGPEYAPDGTSVDQWEKEPWASFGLRSRSPEGVWVTPDPFQIDKTSKVTMFADSVWNGYGRNFEQCMRLDGWAGAVHLRHQEKAHYAYADSHIEALTDDQIKDLSTDKSAGTDNQCMRHTVWSGDMTIKLTH